MPAPKKYTQAQRDEALSLYESSGPTAVTKQFGIPKNTVMRWAKESGTRTVRNEATRAAVEAKVVDGKLRRQELAALLLEDAHKLRKQLWQPARLVNFGGKDNTLAETQLDEPLFVDKKNILSAVGIAVDRVLKLEAVDTDNGVAGAVSMLDRLVEQIGAIGDDGGFPETVEVPEGQ